MFFLIYVCLRYWIREGSYSYPNTCFGVMQRGFNLPNKLSSGSFKIEPKKGKIVQTVCDNERYGGGWTLVTKKSSSSGWNKDSVLERNPNDVSKNDYSIFDLVEDIKLQDAGEVCLVIMFITL